MLRRRYFIPTPLPRSRPKTVTLRRCGRAASLVVLLALSLAFACGSQGLARLMPASLIPPEVKPGSVAAPAS
eukprot:3273317-Prymnesium_polylepis.1